jgi:hypothetical protein
MNKVNYNNELKATLVLLAVITVIVIPILAIAVLPQRDMPSVLDEHRIITKDNIPLIFNDNRYKYVVVAPYKDNEYTIFYHVNGNNLEAKAYSYSITKDIPDNMKQRLLDMYGE